MSLKGQALIDAARSRAEGREPKTESSHGEAVRWATGAGAPAFGARPLPERHRPGFTPRLEGKGMTEREGMYGPRFGAGPAVLTPGQIQSLYNLMVQALSGQH